MKRTKFLLRYQYRTPNYPLLSGAVFLSLTVILYWFTFPAERSVLVLAYMALCIYFLLLGNFVGGTTKVSAVRKIAIRQRWLWLAIVVLVITVTANIATFYDSLADIFVFILEPGEAYERVKFLTRHEQTTETALGTALGPLITILTFSKYVVFGWAVLYWRELSKILRITIWVTFIYYLIQSVLIGAMVNIASVVISTLVFMLAKGLKASKKKTSRAIRQGLVTAGLGIIILSYFLGSRISGVTGLFDRVRAGLEGLVFYISHGYVGLGYSLREPFIFTGGETMFYGFSRLFTDGLSPDSYLVRAAESTGWSATQVWSTAAPWIASDLTFMGVLALILFTGVFAGRLWKICTTTLDPFALLLLGQIIVGVFFFPANNHLFHTFGNATGFIFIVILYIITRHPARGNKTNASPRFTDSHTYPAARARMTRKLHGQDI